MARPYNQGGLQRWYIKENGGGLYDPDVAKILPPLTVETMTWGLVWVERKLKATKAEMHSRIEGISEKRWC